MKRAAILGMLWVPYCIVPIHFGLFEIGVVLFAEEAAQLILSQLGYGFIGSGFYALTGAPQVGTERFILATVVNISFAVLGSLHACSVIA